MSMYIHIHIIACLDPPSVPKRGAHGQFPF